MPGFARLVLDKMKRRSDYGEFLRYVIDSESFRLVTKGAQGSILEDAICFFQKLEGNDVSAKTVVKRCKDLWGEVS
jgi:hypothetical protein